MTQDDKPKRWTPINTLILEKQQSFTIEPIGCILTIFNRDNGHFEIQNMQHYKKGSEIEYMLAEVERYKYEKSLLENRVYELEELLRDREP